MNMTNNKFNILKDLSLDTKIYDYDILEKTIKDISDQLDTLEAKDFEHNMIVKNIEILQNIILKLSGSFDDVTNVIEEQFDTKLKLVAYGSPVQVILPKVEGIRYDICVGEGRNYYTTYDNRTERILKFNLDDIRDTDGTDTVTMWLGNEMPFAPYVRNAYILSAENTSEVYERALSCNLIICDGVMFSCPDSELDATLKLAGTIPEVDFMRISDTMTDLATGTLSACCPKLISFQEDGMLSSVETACACHTELTEVQLPSTVRKVGRAAFGVSPDLSSLVVFDGTELYKDSAVMSMTYDLSRDVIQTVLTKRS